MNRHQMLNEAMSDLAEVASSLARMGSQRTYWDEKDFVAIESLVDRIVAAKERYRALVAMEAA